MRLILVGGFLGAGKTTLLAKAAHALNQRGLRAAVITNDQSGHLVDTALMRANTIPVAEVTEGCFCCHFPSLINAVQTLTERQTYDVILAEPVGSCTDLMATVIRPLQSYYADQFEVAPLSVLLDPTRDVSAFPTLVGYLYEKQLAEADVLIVSKADLLTDEAPQDRLKRAYPGVQVMAISSLTGQGLATWLDLCLSSTSPGTKRLPINYQMYAEAEAALGWLNASGTLTADHDFSPQEWMTDILERLHGAFEGELMQIAHFKAYARTTAAAWKASITRPDGAISWDMQSPQRAPGAEFILNLRANGAPPEIEDRVRAALDTVGRARGLQTGIEALDCFSPAPPQPVYRLTFE